MVVTGLPEHFALYTCMAHMTLLQGDASSSARRAEKITLGEHWEDSSTVLETRKEKGVREKIRTRTAIFIATWCLCKKQLSSAASPSTFILYIIYQHQVDHQRRPLLSPRRENEALDMVINSLTHVSARAEMLNWEQLGPPNFIFLAFFNGRTFILAGKRELHGCEHHIALKLCSCGRSRVHQNA